MTRRLSLSHSRLLGSLLLVFLVGCSAAGTDVDQDDGSASGGSSAGSGGEAPTATGGLGASTGGDAATGGVAATGGAVGSGSADGSGGVVGTGGSSVTDPTDPTVGCVEKTGALQDLGNGTLFDPNTCLMWMKTPFTEVDSGVAGEVTGIIHAQSCDARVEAGRDDWRGPDIAEMRTLTTGCGTWNDNSYLIPELAKTGTADGEFRFWTITPGNDADHTCMLIGAKGTFDGGRRMQTNARVTCVRGTSSVTGSEALCKADCQ